MRYFVYCEDTRYEESFQKRAANTRRDNGTGNAFFNINHYIIIKRLPQM